MAEYIKRKIIVDLLLSKLKYMGDARIMNKNDEKVLSEIDGYEKAIYAVHELLLDKDLIEDIQPVKRGKWKHVAGMNSKCSVCSHYFPVIEFDSRPFDINYCPYCGARMDGDEE